MERIYEHREHGRIGVAKLEITGKGKLALDGKELSERSVEHFLNFALQSLQDAYAGADSADDAKARWQAKYDKIVEGTIGVRTGGSGEEPVMRYVRQVLRSLLGEQSKAEYKALEASEKNDWLDDKFDALTEEQQARVRDAAEKLMAEDIAKKQAAKKLVGGVEIDI